jgi:uncharacterized membrane protein (DUF485 family)
MSSANHAPGAGDLVARVKRDPNYIELEKKRSALGWTLTIIMLLIYFGFIMLVAFFKPLMATQVYGVVTLAFPVGLFVIVSAITITGVYVIRANGEFDRLTAKVVKAQR